MHRQCCIWHDTYVRHITIGRFTFLRGLESNIRNEKSLLHNADKAGQLRFLPPSRGGTQRLRRKEQTRNKICAWDYKWNKARIYTATKKFKYWSPNRWTEEKTIQNFGSIQCSYRDIKPKTKDSLEAKIPRKNHLSVSGDDIQNFCKA